MGNIPRTTPPPDTSLSLSGVAADSKAVSDKFDSLNTEISNLTSSLSTKYFSSGVSDSVTLTQLFDKLRYGHGQCGSVYLSASNGLSTNWYWYIYIPHRNGGNTGDNYQYGALILISFWTSTFYIARYTTGTINVRTV